MQLRCTCPGSDRQEKIPLAVLHHYYMRACTEEVTAFIRVGPHPAAASKRLFADFYAACRLCNY